MRIRWLVAVASLMLLLVTQTALSAYATSVTSVSITPVDLTAGATTTYSVSFFATSPLAADGTITIDWTGDGVSEGVIQPLLPATVTFPSAPCSGTATVANGNFAVQYARQRVCSWRDCPIHDYKRPQSESRIVQRGEYSDQCQRRSGV